MIFSEQPTCNNVGYTQFEKWFRVSRKVSAFSELNELTYKSTDLRCVQYSQQVCVLSYISILEKRTRLTFFIQMDHTRVSRDKLQNVDVCINIKLRSYNTRAFNIMTYRSS